MDVGGGFKVTMIEQQQFVEYKYKKFLLLNVSQNKLTCMCVYLNSLMCTFMNVD